MEDSRGVKPKDVAHIFYTHTTHACYFQITLHIIFVKCHPQQIKNEKAMLEEDLYSLRVFFVDHTDPR